MSDPTIEITAEPEILEDPNAIDRQTFLAKARRFAGKLPFVRDIVAMWFALGDDRTPVWAKAVMAGAVAYFVLPTDLIPDLVVGLGYGDDAMVALSALKSIGTYVRVEHYDRADDWLLRPRVKRETAQRPDAQSAEHPMDDEGSA